MTDEEIVKALGLCAKDSSCLWDSKCPLRNDKDCHVTLSREALDLINRQNKDYIELDLECRELRTELEKELAEHEEFTKQAKAEIERLTELQKDSCLRAVELALENAELQKQVDELTAFKNEAISMSLYGKGRKDGEEVAVKDTAKDLWNDITSYYFALRVLGNCTVELDKLAEFWHKRGVEVE